MDGTVSLWAATARAAAFPQLATSNLRVDVAIVGGGITGITAALLLKRAGKRVVVLEARQVGRGVTSGTTAHITAVLDTRYFELEKKFGKEGARLAADSSQFAIRQIAALVEELDLDCEFEWLPAYLFSEDDDGVEELQRELEAALRAGLRVESRPAPLPFPVKACLCFEQQAQFHPLAYISGLAARVPGNGSHVFEHSPVVAVEEGEPCQLRLENGASLTAERVILATHAPLNRVFLDTQIAQSRSYVVSGPIESAPRGLFWDNRDPYHYVRAHRVLDRSHLIVGGEDHKTGKLASDAEPYLRLEAYAARFGLRSVERRWSAQVVEPVDGLPLVGKNADSEHVYAATGFSGNGMTFGTLSAALLSDLCVGRPNRYSALYAATRLEPLDQVGPGEGKVVQPGGERELLKKPEPERRL